MIELERDWRTDAACLTLPPREVDRVFFTKRGTAEAAQLCASCPVRGACQVTEAHLAAYDREQGRNAPC